MTKTKLLFTTFVIFMSLVFIYHLLEEKEIDKKSNDPPRHLDARDNSGLHQQSEEFGSNQRSSAAIRPRINQNRHSIKIKPPRPHRKSWFIRRRPWLKTKIILMLTEEKQNVL